jgi:hypothetical protein
MRVRELVACQGWRFRGDGERRCSLSAPVGEAAKLNVLDRVRIRLLQKNRTTTPRSNGICMRNRGDGLGTANPQIVIRSKSKCSEREGSHQRGQLRAPALPFVLSIIGLAAACSRTESGRSETVRPVKTMIVAAGDTVDLRSFPGKVDASIRVEPAFQVPGVLVDLPVKEGQKVAKGESIARLRREEFQARLETSQGQLDQARAALSALRLRGTTGGTTPAGNPSACGRCEAGERSHGI